MSTPKPAWELINAYWAFKTYATQEDAAKNEAPGARSYRITHDEKNWYDPDADKPGPGKSFFDIGDAPYVVYENVFMGKLAPDGALDRIALTVDFAKRVNIKPTGPGATNTLGTGKVTPVPLKGPLASTQRIMQPNNPFAPLMIRNLDVPEPKDALGATALMGAIADLATKIDKLLAKFGVS
jgi:hypothetical protein